MKPYYIQIWHKSQTPHNIPLQFLYIYNIHRAVSDRGSRKQIKKNELGVSGSIQRCLGRKIENCLLICTNPSRFNKSTQSF